MKIISWNVNGLRAVLRKGNLVDFLKRENPDILCLQEIKISEPKLEKENISFPGYQFLTNGARREGYSGTAILIKDDILIKDGFLKKNVILKKAGAAKNEKSFKIENEKSFKIKNGLGIDKFDQEGRLQILELPKFYLFNLYFPNANHELSRLDYKLDFNEALLKFLKRLDKNKPVILTGDFNVAHEEIDIARPKDNEGSAGFTLAERKWLSKLLKNNFVDTFRELNSKKIQYSWWSFRFNARPRNLGWRIDYFVVSDRIKKYVKKAYILDQELGSDHAPIGLEIY